MTKPKSAVLIVVCAVLMAFVAGTADADSKKITAAIEEASKSCSEHKRRNTPWSAGLSCM